MSVSEKQLAANRQNARKSTGPKTENGKAAASQNAVKHGLYARNIVINSPRLKEDQAEYEHLFDSLFDELKPKGLFEENLVRKIANSLWRSHRAVTAETAQINRQLENVDSDLDFAIRIKQRGSDFDFDNQSEMAEFTSQTLSILTGIKSIPNENSSFNILRYEMRLDRQLTRAYKLLKHLQFQRETKSLQDRFAGTTKPLQRKT